MSFNSVQFLIFFGLFFVTYWLARPADKNRALLVASYVFYGMWDWRFLSLLAFSTVVDFSVGRALHRSTAPGRRKLLLLVSMTANLGLLGIFKYLNFFAASFAELMGGIGLAPNEPLLNILLPVGISFYTFQTMSYTIDVYRRKLEPVTRFTDFATYVAFFPQLVAGPIERARVLLPQIVNTDRTLGRAQLTSGLGLILMGLVKKVVVADGVAHIADRAFSQPGEASMIVAWAGVLAFSLQIYGDFAGYTDMARGVSRLLGIELSLNFAQPYLSRNITEFWRRWHISLSNWLRDYLYISLGGNRKGTARTRVNLMATMLLGGLWHGASWNFVVWGGLHGLYLVVHKLTRDGRVPTEEPRWRDIPAMATTFVAVSLTWVFFRSPDFATSAQFFRSLVRLEGEWSQSEVLLVSLAALSTLGLDLVTRHGRLSPAMVSRQPMTAGVLTGLAIAAVVLFSGGDPRPFVYFQF